MSHSSSSFLSPPEPQCVWFHPADCPGRVLRLVRSEPYGPSLLPNPERGGATKTCADCSKSVQAFDPLDISLRWYESRGVISVTAKAAEADVRRAGMPCR